MFNNASKSLANIVNMGFKSGQQETILMNDVILEECELPILSGLSKDHKNGSKMRPMVNAMDGPKKSISDNNSVVVAAIVGSNDNGTLCSSTEEWLESLEAYNKRKDENNESTDNKIKRVTGSMDAVSLFTSLESKKVLGDSSRRDNEKYNRI